MKLNLHMMTDMKDTLQQKKHLKALLIIWKEDFLKQIATGKEKRLVNINLIKNVKVAMDIG